MAHRAMPAASTAMLPAQQLNERFATLYTTYLPRITALVGSRIFNADDKHLTDDLTAEAFTRVWLHLHKCEATTDAQTYSWIATIARRTVADHFRVKKNTMERPADLGDWQYANRPMDQAAGYYTPAESGFRTAATGQDRRLVAVGTIRRHGGRTTTVRATEAGVTGTITSACPICRVIFEACTCTGGAQ
ncbi:MULTISPECIES: RNA polymerase sigma factor [Streptomyces]|uniref:RNA polymerase sigma factor n=1 Tax=Streptomyces TaxID=1883 RepID=UPI0009987B88|nr:MULTISPECIES: sigma factor [Streptomyces]